MDSAEPDTHDFSRQRRAGMKYIAVSAVVAILLWLGIDLLVPPLDGMESLGGPMLFSLKCCCVAVLFSLVAVDRFALRRHPPCADQRPS